jgi:hypothetical protein
VTKLQLLTLLRNVPDNAQVEILTATPEDHTSILYIRMEVARTEYHSDANIVELHVGDIVGIVKVKEN